MLTQTIKTVNLHHLREHWDYGPTVLTITMQDEAVGSMFDITARMDDVVGTIRVDLPELEQLVEAARTLAHQPAVVAADTKAAKYAKPFEEQHD